jgi:hypothetical protein
MSKRALYICGASGLAREVLELARSVNAIEQRGVEDVPPPDAIVPGGKR